MKRLVLILGLVLMLALAACDTMGPSTQEVLPTDIASAETTGDLGTPVAAETTPEVLPTAPAGEQPETGAETPGADLLGVTWEWVSVLDPMGQTTATDPTRYTIVFNDGGTANLRADCNNVIANYITDGVNLNIEPGPSTLAACPPDTQDQLFLNSVSAAASYVVQDGELFITMTGDSGTIIFRSSGSGGAAEAPATPSLTGVTWEWVSTTTPAEEITAADPTRYNIIFNDDGTAGIKADCNVGGATYTTGEDGSIAITLGVSTLAFCENSQDTQFRAGLAAAATYSFDENGDLLIDLTADSGTMRFRAGGALESIPAEGDTLTGVTWEWVSTTTPVQETAVVDPTRYTILFNEDGTANIKADCNSVGATYTAGEDSTMTITLGPTTLVACPPDSQADTFMAGLPAVAIYSFLDGDLLLDMAVDSGTMRFRAAAPETAPAGDTLTGVTWQWVSTTTPVEEITVADPTRYNVVFNEDGTANLKADCNVGTATYTTGEGGTISIIPGAMTLAMCPADSQSTQFLSGLSAAAVYFFQDGDLLIDQFASGGTMRFTPATTAEAGGPIKGETGTVTVPGAPSELVGPTWQLALVTKLDGNITLNDPSRYTIVFNADGTANIQADCNVVGATYTTGEGGALTITLGPSTMAFCGPGSLDQIYLGGLSNAMSYRIEEGNLLIDMLYESGTLVFHPAQ